MAIHLFKKSRASTPNINEWVRTYRQDPQAVRAAAYRARSPHTAVRILPQREPERKRLQGVPRNGVSPCGEYRRHSSLGGRH